MWMAFLVFRVTRSILKYAVLVLISTLQSLFVHIGSYIVEYQSRLYLCFLNQSIFASLACVSNLLRVTALVNV